MIAELLFTFFEVWVEGENFGTADWERKVMYGMGVHPASLHSLGAGRLSSIRLLKYVDLFFLFEEFS